MKIQDRIQPSFFKLGCILCCVFPAFGHGQGDGCGVRWGWGGDGGGGGGCGGGWGWLIS